MEFHHCPSCGFQIRAFQTIDFGNISINEGGQMVFSGSNLDLPPSQYILIDALIRAKGRPLQRSLLANLLGSDINNSTVTKYIERARDAFRRIDGDFSQIQCMKGFGSYRWIYKASQYTADLAIQEDSSINPNNNHSYFQ